MKSPIAIELFEEHDKVNFYTLRFQDEETEVDKFLDQFPEGCEYDEDIDIIIRWIDQIGKSGALQRYFRPEGKPGDHVCAIPIETTHLRLYVIRLSEHIVILGNGGVKTTRTYNEDPFLNSCVELLQEVDGYIKSRVQKGQLVIYEKQLFRNLTFHLKSKK
ncbi:hypothetical protein [uncultured Sunxiuqinia sp.]|uniref:hypothetical protein n=1 Tax=uncultured Sunxiuqinia sp. TaxID=1573825 RepID=UPI0030DB22B6